MYDEVTKAIERDSKQYQCRVFLLLFSTNCCFEIFGPKFRVTLVVAYLGWVDYNFGHSVIPLSPWFCVGRWELQFAE